MTIDELNALPIEELQQRFDEVLANLYDDDPEYKQNLQTWIDEYNMKHAILDRPDKMIEAGKKKVETAKLTIPFQKKIVSSAVSFLFGTPVKLIKNNEEESFDKLFQEFQAVWDSAKLNYHNKRLARRLFIETRVAELYYVRKSGDENKIKVLILCNQNGDEIYPIWDDYGDMTGFLRMYEVDDKENDKTYPKVELYTAEWIYVAEKASEWSITKTENLVKKIPVVYYEQENPEWHDVQALIDRVEMQISKNADTNDYFGSPAVVSKGVLKSAPDKGEVGKFFEIEPVIDEGRATFGDLSYLTWDQTPEAIKLEYETLKDLIYSQTATPDLSFNNVKGTSNLSGIALKFMFFDSILKAKDKEEIFGEGIERRINLLKAIMSNVMKVKDYSGMDKLNISVDFQEALPENVVELIETLSAAVGGEAIMSQEAAVKQNPFIDNPEEEVEILKKAKEDEQKLNQSYV